MDKTKLIEITRPGDGQSLCRTCYWAHAQKGFRESEEAIFCMFGPMRKVPFRVRDCTDYMNRTLPTRDQMEKIALIIPTEPARKKLGILWSRFQQWFGRGRLDHTYGIKSSPEAIDPVTSGRGTSVCGRQQCRYRIADTPAIRCR